MPRATCSEDLRQDDLVLAEQHAAGRRPRAMAGHVAAPLRVSTQLREEAAVACVREERRCRLHRNQPDPQPCTPAKGAMERRHARDAAKKRI